MRSVAVIAVFFLVAAPARGQDVNDKAEAAIKAAVARVAPSVVRIETAGGAEVVGLTPGGGAMGGGVRKGRGPTTGLVVAPDEIALGAVGRVRRVLFGHGRASERLRLARPSLVSQICAGGSAWFIGVGTGWS